MMSVPPSEQFAKAGTTKAESLSRGAATWHRPSPPTSPSATSVPTSPPSSLIASPPSSPSPAPARHPSRDASYHSHPIAAESVSASGPTILAIVRAHLAWQEPAAASWPLAVLRARRRSP